MPSLDVGPGATPTQSLDTLHLLVVEDSPPDQRLILEALLEAGASRERVVCVPTLRDARQALIDRPAGCVLLDLSLPDATGLEGITLLSAPAPSTPLAAVPAPPARPLLYPAMA